MADMRPVKVNLKKPETWPRGWQLAHNGKPVVEAPTQNHQVLVSFHHLWSGTSLLFAGNYWLPMPPAPTSRKWRTK